MSELSFVFETCVYWCLDRRSGLKRCIRYPFEPLRLIENESASKNISETASKKEKLLIGFFSCGSIKVRR